MGKLDRLGRATFHHIAAQSGVCPTNREIRWLKHIERHGPQSSVHLFELTRDTHRCLDSALRDLQKLRAGGFLCLPPQQRATERAEFKPYIYDLTPKAMGWLADRGLKDQALRPTGPWWHACEVASVTSSIDIAAGRAGVRFIPAHDILARKGATLAVPIGGKRLIPDQLLALDYGGSFRAFVLEVDQGTEPGRSDRARKSITEMLGQYDRLFAEDRLRQHYGLRCPVGLLLVTNGPGRLQLVRSLACAFGSALNSHLLLQNLSDRPEPYRAEDCLGGWERPDGRPFDLRLPTTAHTKSG